MAGSFFEKFTGAHLPPTQFPRFEFDADKCTHCKLCAATCPTSCIQWDEARDIPYSTGYKGIELACISCNNCESVCPSGAIRVRGEYRVLRGRYQSPGEPMGEMKPAHPFGQADLERDFKSIASDLTETEQVIYNRRSIRMFKDEPVPRELIHRIIEAARFAPSAGNGQPVKFIVSTNPSLNRMVDRKCTRVLNAIKWLYGGSQWWRKATVTLLSWLMVNKWDQRPICAMEKVSQTDGDITFSAPVVIHILKDTRGISHPDIEIGITAQNLVLAAHALGLGTCYIGFIASTLKYVPSVKKALGIEYPYELGTSICVGYPKMKRLNPIARGMVPVEWLS